MLPTNVVPSCSHINSSSEFILLQCNVRSITSRLGDLCYILNSYKCNVAFLSETWLLPNRSFTIPSYKLIRHDRADGYGGAAIAVQCNNQVRKIDINHNLLLQLESLDINLVGVELLDPRPFQIWSIYILPHSNITVNIIDSILKLVNSSDAIIAGDFNGHHFTWGSNSTDHSGNLIYSSLSSTNLCVLNNSSPTRINRPPHKHSVIDISIVSSNLFWSSTWETLEDPHGSDHIPIKISIPIHNLASNVHDITYNGINVNAINWTLF